MSAPVALGDRGKDIWDAYGADTLPAGSRAMVLELARLADTLDKLDAILGGRETEWARLVDIGEGEIILEVDKLLGERRQNALALKVLYQELRTAGIKEKDSAKDETKGRAGLVLSLVQNAAG